MRGSTAMGVGGQFVISIFFKSLFLLMLLEKKYVVTCLGKHGDLDLPRYKNELYSKI